MSDLKVGRIEFQQLTFTPGPWLSDGQFVKAGKRIVAEAFTLPAPHLPAPANAHLIAAAPDLLAAATLAALHFERTHAAGEFQGDDEHEAWTALRSAIAKAEGRL